MKFKHCNEETGLRLRKPSVKRMHRPHKQEAMMRGREIYNRLFAKRGLLTNF